jgi:DNA-binding Xre family transcriptional regulator
MIKEKLERVSMIRLRLKEVLTEKNITQAKLSRLTDVSMNTIQAIYHNPFHDVALSTLERLAKGLKVDVSELYEVLPDEDKPS